MQKGNKKYQKEYPDFSETQEQGFFCHLNPTINLMRIESLASLITSLMLATSNHPEPRSRLIIKLIELDFEKTHRLIDILLTQQSRLDPIEQFIQTRLARISEPLEIGFIEEMYQMRCENGLFVLQKCALCLICLMCDVSIAQVLFFRSFSI